LFLKDALFLRILFFVEQPLGCSNAELRNDILFWTLKDADYL